MQPSHSISCDVRGQSIGPLVFPIFCRNETEAFREGPTNGTGDTATHHFIRLALCDRGTAALPIRAITATVDGRVIGLGGIAFPPQGPAIAFAQLAPRPTVSRCSDSNDVSQATPEAKRYPVAFHRAGLLAMAMIRESGSITSSRPRRRTTRLLCVGYIGSGSNRRPVNRSNAKSCSCGNAGDAAVGARASAKMA